MRLRFCGVNVHYVARGWWATCSDYHTTNTAAQIKERQQNLDNMLSIVSGLRHGALEFGTLLKQRSIQPIS